MNKKLHIMAGRCQLIGDMICAHPIAKYFKKKYPDCYLIWPIAKKVSQCAPLYLNNPYIDQIYIFDGQEGPESEQDWNIINSCDIKINPNPSHPDNEYPQKYNIYSETWRMSGLPIEEWNKLTDDEKQPVLVKWWNNPVFPLVPIRQKNQKTIAYWPQAGYGAENKRNASWNWCRQFIKNLQDEGYEVWQFGSNKDWLFDLNIKRFNHLSFFEQIQLSLIADLSISTDSGSALILGAYKHKQISLLTDHWGNTDNPMALSTNNPNNISFFAPDSADNIKIENIINTIKSI